jgi:hypothetical protein
MNYVPYQEYNVIVKSFKNSALEKLRKRIRRREQGVSIQDHTERLWHRRQTSKCQDLCKSMRQMLYFASMHDSLSKGHTVMPLAKPVFAPHASSVLGCNDYVTMRLRHPKLTKLHAQIIECLHSLYRANKSIGTKTFFVTKIILTSALTIVCCFDCFF